MASYTLRRRFREPRTDARGCSPRATACRRGDADGYTILNQRRSSGRGVGKIDWDLDQIERGGSITSC